MVQGKKRKLRKALKNVEYVSDKNLEDLYDKEGYRDNQFDKKIKELGLSILKWQFKIKENL